MNTSAQIHHPHPRRGDVFAENLLRIEREAPKIAVETQRATPNAAPPIRRVLVLLDGTNCAEHAIPVASEIARRASARLQLAHADLLLGSACNDRSFPREEAQNPHHQQRMRDYLDAFSRRLSIGDAEVLFGARGATDLASLVGRETLVVIATHYHGAFGGFQFGSLSERFLSLNASSILFVKGYRWPVDLHAPIAIRRILTFLDGSAEGERIVWSAASLTKAVSARHTLLGVVPTMPYAGIPWKEKVEEASVYLQDWAEELRCEQEQDSTPATEIRSSDAPLPQVILAYAQQSESDVIAITARNRSRISRLLRPEPAEYLVKYSRIPILVTRPN